MICSTPPPFVISANTKGPSPRMDLLSRSMTDRSAPTAGARSTLLITKQIGLRDARTAFARDLVAASNIDDINRVVGKFSAEVGRQIVPSRFKQQDFGVKLVR